MSSPRRGISELPFLCHSFGIEHVVISPGSRNAPLIIAFASDARFTCTSIVDERSAAYYALGMAQQLRKSVALVCTSGTAMINYAPALAEAFYMRIPLVAITADRPAEWIDQNDGQTIRQRNFYANIIKGSFEIPVDTHKEEDLWLSRRTVSEALTLCRSGNPGPVHINVPLREPLYEHLPLVTLTPAITRMTAISPTLAASQWATIHEKWDLYNRKLIICGMGHYDPQLTDNLSLMVASNEAVVIAENLSNLPLDGGIHSPDRFIASLTPEDKKQLHPSLLITMGGPVLSKRLKKYLRSHKPSEHWHIGTHEPFIDTYQALSLNIDINPTDFLERLAGTGLRNKEYVQHALAINKQSKQRHEEYFSNIAWSDLQAWQELMSNIPEDCNIHLANSTPVRYAQLFNLKKGVRYYSNRGTSGIDGCVSTAAGAAMVRKKTNIAIVGDLAFIYDSNALWNNNLPANLRIVVIDNGGGNIFKLIDTSPVIDPIRRFFETPHKVKIDKLCEAFGLEYFFADSPAQLQQVSADFFKPKDRAGVLHIQTTGEISAQVFKQYYQHLAQHNEHDKKLEND